MAEKSDWAKWRNQVKLDKGKNVLHNFGNNLEIKSHFSCDESNLYEIVELIHYIISAIVSFHKIVKE